MKPKASPKDFFLWAAAMVSLYASVVSLIMLLFSYIEYAFPDALSYVDPYSTSIRFAIASLVVLAPTFLILMRVIRSDIEGAPEKFDLWVRRWALYFTLFVAGITIVVDLITLINYFLNGDVTTRFVLKVLVVLLVVGGGPGSADSRSLQLLVDYLPEGLKALPGSRLCVAEAVVDDINYAVVRKPP